ncbi:MAG: outer membrane lipoprotein-sorting protein [Deltaproteobacteria bacterium]|nr:outer membrane lipoprotein-sorting protein [Deltaproteobacteria bacterium]
MRIAPGWGLLLALAMAPGSPARAGSEAAAGVAPIEACLRRNLPQRSSEQSVRFESKDRTGSTRTLAGTAYWKKWEGDLSRSLIRIDFPPDLRGSAYLLIERPETVDVFVYLPEFQKVRRITSHALAGSLFGTDFSYEDMRRLRHLFEAAAVERQPDAEQAGRATYVVTLRPPPESEYGEVRAWIDQETCVPLRLELFARGGSLAKELTADPSSLTKHGEVWAAHTVVLRDLQEQTETRVELGRLEIDTNLPDKLFSERALTQGN